jgi:hypothetical protein
LEANGCFRKIDVNGETEREASEREKPFPLQVADLSAQPDRRQRVDPAQAQQPPDGVRPRRTGYQLADRALQRVTADEQSVDRAEIVEHRELRGTVGELLGPATLAHTHRTADLLLSPKTNGGSS